MAEKQNSPAEIQEPIPVTLTRDMGLMHVTMIGVGAMIGAGIFVLTGIAAGQAGPALLLAFFLNGLVTALTALAYAELGSCFPEAGGGYLWVKEALPQPNGFLAGWMSWFAHAVACSLYAIAFGAFFTELIHGFGFSLAQWFQDLGLTSNGFGFSSKLIAVVIIALFSYVNFRGAKETGVAETIVTSLKILVIGLFILFGLVFMFSGKIAWQSHFQSFFPRGMGGVIIAMGLTFIAFEGYEIIAQCGEEVKHPKRNIPLSIIISLLIVVPLYLLVAFVALGAVQSGGVPSWVYLGQEKELAMIRASEQFMPFGEVIFLIGGLLSTMSALNATIYSSSRVSFAMGRDFNLPHLFSRIHATTKTPHWAVFLSALFITIMAVALPLEDVASATDAMFLLLFVLVNMALINLRKHRPDLDRGFRVPWVPFLPLLAILLNVFLAGFLFIYRPVGIIVTVAYIVGGVVVFLLYASRKEARERQLPVIFEQKPVADKTRHHILVPVANPKTVGALLQLASLLAGRWQSAIHLLHIVLVPAQLPLKEGNRFLEDGKAILEQALQKQKETNIPTGALIKVSHSVPQAIIETVKERNVNLVVLGWQGHIKRRNYIFGTILDEMIMNSPCDILMLRTTRQKFMDDIKRILMPIGKTLDMRLGLDVARALADSFDLPVRLLHICPKEKKEERERSFQSQLAKLSETADMQRFQLAVVTGTNVLGSILSEVNKTDLLVMDAAEEGLVRRALLGEIPENIARTTKVPIIFTKQYTGAIKSWLQKFFGSRKSLIS
jgi:amino acid transporter/nucleotide-binding universal stress UspA family protein